MIETNKKHIGTSEIIAAVVQFITYLKSPDESIQISELLDAELSRDNHELE